MKKAAAFILVALSLAGCSQSHQVQLAYCGLPLDSPIDIQETVFFTVGDMTLSKDGSELNATGTLDDRAFYAWGPDIYPTGHMFLVFTGEDETGGLHVLDWIEYDQDPVWFSFYEMANPEPKRYMQLVVP